jgi:hypothetical protein
MKPKISVVSIAKDMGDLEHLALCLEKQTFDDFEFVYSIGGSIPEAWNEAISRAKGDYLLFTESDAKPISEDWIKQAWENRRKDSVVKGLEIVPTDLNMCNLMCDRGIFDSVRFQEDYMICEDTELFARLKKKGIDITRSSSFPVVHQSHASFRKTIVRAPFQGFYSVKIMRNHGKENISTLENQWPHLHGVMHPILNRLRIIIDNTLFLLGIFGGGAVYLLRSVFRNRDS